MTNKKKVLSIGMSTSQQLQEQINNTHYTATTRRGKHKIRTINTQYAPLSVQKGRHNVEIHGAKGKKFWTNVLPGESIVVADTTNYYPIITILGNNPYTHNSSIYYDSAGGATVLDYLGNELSYVDIYAGGYSTDNGYTIYLTDSEGNFISASRMSDGVYYEVYKATTTVNDARYTTIDKRIINAV